MRTLAQSLLSDPWHISQPAWAHLAQASNLPINPQGYEGQARPEKDFLGNALPQLQMIGRLAIVPIDGALVKNASGFDKWYYGVTSHEDIHSDLDTAVSKGAAAILLAVNSPGGTVLGTPELAARIAELVAGGIEVVSFTDTMKCSAAEYITAAASIRFCTPSAYVGSIGTIMESVSFKKLYDRVGIEFNVFTSGQYKAMGHPALELTDEQKEFLKSFVSERAAEFKTWMTQHRRKLPESAMQGQVFTGSNALKIGLIDHVVNNRAEAIRFIDADGSWTS